MHALTTDDLQREPQRLLDDAQCGLPSIVTRDGEPVMLALPLDADETLRGVRLDIAAGHYDRDQISLGLAARLAGLSYGDMIDGLGRRGVAMSRLQPGELEQELAVFTH